MDLDFCSIQVAVLDLPNINSFYALAVARDDPQADPRATSLLQITGQPLCIYINESQLQTVRAFKAIGITIQPNANHLVLSEKSHRTLSGSTIVRALLVIGVAHVIVYTYGMKLNVQDPFATVLTNCAANGGSTENLFDLAITTKTPRNFVLHRLEPRSRLRGDTYPLFKTVGHGHGSVQFISPDWPTILKVKIYCPLIHLLKSFGPLIPPRHMSGIRRFRDAFKATMEAVVSNANHHCGFRTELTIRARVPDIDFWSTNWPVWCVSRINVTIEGVIQQLVQGFEAANDLGVFCGRNTSELSGYKKFIISDLLNLIGFSTPQMQSDIRHSGPNFFMAWISWLEPIEDFAIELSNSDTSDNDTPETTETSLPSLGRIFSHEDDVQLAILIQQFSQDINRVIEAARDLLPETHSREQIRSRVRVIIQHLSQQHN